MIRPNSQLDIPVFVYFREKNPFVGSHKNFNFKIALCEEGLKVETWQGKFCYDKSDIQQEQVFPPDDDGLNQLIAWLDSQI